MEYRLGDVIEFNPKEKLSKGKKYKKISMEMLQSYKKYIGKYIEEEYKGGSKFRNGDTLLARITPCLENGKTAQVNELKENEIGFGSTEFIVMRQINRKSDKDFIYYLSISKEFRDIAIKSMTGTSGRQRAQVDVLKDTIMDLPEYNEQIKIAKILSRLDKKIELNNQINNNLYEIIKVQYNNFISKLLEYDLVKLKDIAIISSGKRPKTKGKEYKIPLIGASGIMSYTNDYNSDSDILVIGRVGTLGVVQRYFDKVWLSDNIISIKTKYMNTLENYFKYVDYQSLNRGSTQPLITQTDISNLEIKFNKKKFVKFENEMRELRKKIELNNEQSKVLEKLKDTLLPKLLNGKINLDKIKC